MKNTSVLALIAALSLGAAAPAYAQEVNLRSQDGAIDIFGDLVSFDDDTYILRTDLGDLRVSADRADCFGEACPVDSSAQEETSNEVVLSSVDGSISIPGILLDFQNDNYLVETAAGKLEIPAAAAICAGAACPILRVDLNSFKIASSGALSDGLLKTLLDAFADEGGNKLATSDNSPAGGTGYTISAPEGEEETGIDVLTQSSQVAVQSLLDGSSDLAAVTRSLREEERNNLIGEDADDFTQAESETVLALDALAIVVSGKNPVRAIAEEDLARVFSGEINDWADLGGNPGPINIYARDAESGTAVVFDDLVMSPSRKEIAPQVTYLSSDSDISDAVLTDPQAIGYTSYSALGNAKPLAVRGECGVQTPVNEFTIKTEEYPLSRRIYMYKPTTSIPQVANDFLDFVKSNDAQAYVQKAGYIGQTVSWRSVNEQGLRFVSTVLPTDADSTYEDIQEMLTELVAADRLSLTFRFNPGSARLDTKAQADVLRLAEQIESGFFEGKEILVTGFTDSIGLGEVNENLSLARAEQVMNLVKGNLSDADAVPMRAIGYGEMSPLACNETINGRAVNRRVEVWMRDLIGGSGS